MGSGHCDSSQPFCNGGSHLTSLKKIWFLPACTGEGINTVKDAYFRIISHPSGYFKEKPPVTVFWASKNTQWMHVPAFYIRQLLILSAIGCSSPQMP